MSHISMVCKKFKGHGRALWPFWALPQKTFNVLSENVRFDIYPAPLPHVLKSCLGKAVGDYHQRKILFRYLVDRQADAVDSHGPFDDKISVAPFRYGNDEAFGVAFTAP